MAMATVIEADASITSGSGTAVARIWWRAAGEHLDVVQSPNPVKAGDLIEIEIWVDIDGNLADPPTPRSHAAVDAVATTLALVLGVVITMRLLVVGERLRVDQLRDAAWDREIQCLQDDDGGRTSQY